MESPTSLISCRLANDSNDYYCVGTAYVYPEEAEPKNGRLILFHLAEGQINLFINLFGWLIGEKMRCH